MHEVQSTPRRNDVQPSDVETDSWCSGITDTDATRNEWSRQFKTARILSTAVAWAASQESKCLARVLFDGGSQRTFVTEQLAEKLCCQDSVVEIRY